MSPYRRAAPPGVELGKGFGRPTGPAESGFGLSGG